MSLCLTAIIVFPPSCNIPSRPEILILCHERLLRNGRLPQHISTIPNRPVFISPRKDTPVSTIPGPAEGKSPRLLRRNGGIRSLDSGAMHIHPEFIGIDRIRPLPRRDPASTPTKNQVTSFLGSVPCKACIGGWRNDENTGVDIVRVYFLRGGCSPIVLDEVY